MLSVLEAYDESDAAAAAAAVAAAAVATAAAESPGITATRTTAGTTALRGGRDDGGGALWGVGRALEVPGAGSKDRGEDGLSPSTLPPPLASSPGSPTWDLCKFITEARLGEGGRGGRLG